MNLGEKIRQFLVSFVGNETAMEDKQKALYNLVQGMNKQGPTGSFWHYIEKTYDAEKYCIICQDGPNGQTYFKVSFETDEVGIPTKLGTDFQEMVRDVVYNPKPAGNEEGEPKPGCGCPHKGKKGKKGEMMDDEYEEEMMDKKKAAQNAAEMFAQNHGSHDQKTHGKKGGGGGKGSTKEALAKVGITKTGVGEVNRLGNDSKKAGQIEKLMKSQGYSSESASGNMKGHSVVVYKKGKSEYQMSIRATADGNMYSFSKVM